MYSAVRRRLLTAVSVGLGLGALMSLEACQFFDKMTGSAEEKQASERTPQEETAPAKRTTAPGKAPERAEPSDARQAEPSAEPESERVEKSRTKPPSAKNPEASEPVAAPTGETPEPAPELTDTFMADSRITVAIQMKLTGDRNSNFARVDVETSHGVVTLTGTVDSDEEKRRAAELARRIDGVARVDNNIRIE